MPGLGVQRGIRLLEKSVGELAWLNVRAMIDELSNRNFRSQLSQAAEMITVPVGDDQMIDLPQASVLDRILDAARIAGSRSAGVPGVDQQRLTGRRDEERGVTALDVDD